MRSLKKTIAILALAALLAIGAIPAQAYGANSNDPVSLTVSSTLFVMQGTSSYVDVEAKAAEDVSYTLVLECPDRSITLDSSRSGVLTGNAKQSFSFNVNKRTEIGYKTFTVKAVSADDPASVLGQQDFYVDVVENINSFSSLGQASINATYAITGSDSLTAGQVNFVKLTLFNRGDTIINNAKVEIFMPEGFSIQSGPASRNIGTFSIGENNSVDYPILVDADMVTGSYPFTIKVSGTRGGEAKIASEAIYIPLIGKDKQVKDETVPMLIVDSFDYGNNNGVMKRGQDFTLKMKFRNTGSKDISNVVINVLDSSGAVQPTGTSYIKIDSIKAGETADGSIALRTVADTDVIHTNLSVEMNYYYDEDTKNNQTTYPIGVSIEKKPEEEDKKNGVANPILMVTDYDLGGNKAVLAGKDFPLSLTLTNTSAKTLCNIKVTVQDSTGSVLPAEGSNSFFIRSIAPGASYGKLLPMTVGNDITAGNSTIAVNMSYEDLDAHTFTSSDTITVPVTQEDRLVIDDILDPGWLMAGEQGFLQIKYYNMGKTTLNNLRIAVSGDFTIDGDSSQYVGNMANGRSDYFSFNFFPNEEGECKGKAVFTYENAQGEEQVIEKEFTLNIQPAPQYEDPGDMPIEPVKGPTPLWEKILIGAGVAAAAVAAVVLGKKRKKAKAEALELDE